MADPHFEPSSFHKRLRKIALEAYQERIVSSKAKRTAKTACPLYSHPEVIGRIPLLSLRMMDVTPSASCWKRIARLQDF